MSQIQVQSPQVQGHACAQCGFGSRRKKFSKKFGHSNQHDSRGVWKKVRKFRTVRKFRRVSRKVRKLRRVNSPRFGRSKFGRLRRNLRRSFGKMDIDLNRIMSNSDSNNMSLFQSYTGESPGQMEEHLQDIPTNLRTNFYANINTEAPGSCNSYGRRHRKFRRSNRFGKFNTDLAQIMGNNDGGNPMSSFQQYTGLPPQEMSDHLADVPISVRTNFYNNIQ